MYKRQVRGRVALVEVPVEVVREGPTLTARGAFTLAQSALGLTPFSVFAGALQVRDQLEVRFRIVAEPVPPGQ